MGFLEGSCEEFVERTFSKDPAPGGGGVAALTGALGTALGGMVCNLTTGKKKYAEYQSELDEMIVQLEKLTKRLNELVDEDAVAFLPLSRAYSLPATTDEERKAKEEEMQRCLKIAIDPPVQVIKVSAQAIDCLDRLYRIGSRLAVSDVGVGATLIRSAVMGAWLSVTINLNSVTDSEYVDSVRAEVVPILNRAIAECDKIYYKVLGYLEDK